MDGGGGAGEEATLASAFAFGITVEEERKPSAVLHIPPSPLCVPADSRLCASLPTST